MNYEQNARCQYLSKAKLVLIKNVCKQNTPAYTKIRICHHMSDRHISDENKDIEHLVTELR